MKIKLKTIVVFSVIFGFFLSTGLNLLALSTSAGLKLWAGWNNNDIFFMQNEEYPGVETDESNINAVPLININPSLNLRFDSKNSISLNAIVSGLETLALQREVEADNAENKDIPGLYLDSYSYSLLKIDSDLLYSRRINNRFGLFTGFKYMMIQQSGTYNIGVGELDSSILSSLGVSQLQTSPTFSGTQNALGYGLGLNANKPLSDSVFLLGALSGTYLVNYYDKEIQSSTSVVDDTTYEGTCSMAAVNGKLSVAYFHAPTRITYETGLQGQLLFYLDTISGDDIYSGETLFVVGPIMSVIFSF